jgi:hypothetical protein
MRRGQESPAAKPLENQGLETPGEKNSPTPQLSRIKIWKDKHDTISLYCQERLTDGNAEVKKLY